MRIDAHQHFWTYNEKEFAWIDDSMAPLQRNFTPEDLEPELKRNKIDVCIAVQTRQTLEETHYLLDLAAKHPIIAGVVGWVDLRSPEVHSQLKALATNPKLVGIRHIVQAEPDDRFLLQPDFLRGIAHLEEFNFAYDILIYPKHLPAAIEFVERFPRHRFVLDHLAKPLIKDKIFEPWTQQICELANFPNVYCKLSGMVTEAHWINWKADDLTRYMDIAMAAFGPDRLMYGSDWPVCLVAAPYSRVFEAVKNYVTTRAPNSLEAILGENAARFWRLKI